MTVSNIRKVHHQKSSFSFQYSDKKDWENVASWYFLHFCQKFIFAILQFTLTMLKLLVIFFISLLYQSVHIILCINFFIMLVNPNLSLLPNPFLFNLRPHPVPLLLFIALPRIMKWFSIVCDIFLQVGQLTLKCWDHH